MKKIADLLIDISQSFPNRFALTDCDISVSYDELNGYVEKVSDALIAVGCGTGVSVGLILPNSIEYLVAFFAISRAGGTIVPINYNCTDVELGKLIARCNISIIVCNNQGKSRRFPDALPTLLVATGVSTGDICIETVFFEDPFTDRDLNDVALLLGTSGTDKSKLVMLTDKNLIANMNSYRQTMAFEGIQRVYCVLPMHHIYSISAQILTHISGGDELYIYRSPFDVFSFLKTVQNCKITVTSFVPYMTNLLTKASKSIDYNMSSLRIITIAGAKASANVIQSLHQNFPQTKFLPTYGLTEASPRVSLVRPNDEMFPPASAGKPLPGVMVKIGNSSPKVEGVGEVYVKSEGVMKGYYKEKEATADVLKDGWLQTGDLGFIDDSGYLHIVGRKKNLIISGGMNIYPSEIEECLREHGSIEDAVALAMKHDLLQEVPCAFVESSGVDEVRLISELKANCIESLSLYKVPYKFICLEKIPRLANSKVDYSKLRGLVNEFN